MTNCTLCPRRCGAVRTENKAGGFCASPETALVTRAAPHYGEEPCISGSRGSGTVFFSGCNLRCVFCQNHAISRGGAGTPVTVDGLRDIFLRLRDQGVHNINLVTPTHFSGVIARALEGLDLGIPVVWNSSGYESVETLRSLEGLVQVYLPDYKYADPALAKALSAAEDYPTVALAALREMFRQVGPFQMDEEGLLRRGLLVRHLILPGYPENTLRCLDAVEDNLPPKKILFSLMSQYTPMPGLPEDFPELRRRVSPEEYERCLSYLDFSEIDHGYCQSPESATDEMIPDFDGTGV
ncbi:MAG: radical SAM protein [Oscillospiraceae bacterium]